MDRVISFAETQVAPRRIVMGLGFYGRDWQGSTTTDLLWHDVTTIRTTLHPRETRTASGELYLGYKKDGAAHQAFFPDGPAIRAKLRMMLLAPPAHPRRLRLGYGPGGPARLARAAQGVALGRPGDGRAPSPASHARSGARAG